MNIIFKCNFGSSLYGTSTPISDKDYKGVYIAELSDIVLKRDEATIKHSTGSDFSRNTKDDVDTEYKELRTFLKEAMDGQTYALDMLFCNSENIIQSSPVWDSLIENRPKLLSKNVTPFLGYCRQQAEKYSIKGTRLGELERVIELLESQNMRVHVADIICYLPKLEYVFITEHNNETFLAVLGKHYQINKTCREVLNSLVLIRNKYGARAVQARANEGVDWKALSHAYRCMYEVRDLLTTGNIIFPLKEAEYLIKIKTGQIAYSVIQDELADLMNEVKAIESPLPEKPDYEFWDYFIIKTYLKNNG